MGMKTRKTNPTAYVISTAHRGVFFGYSSDTPEDIAATKTVSLTNGRMCLYWSSAVRGFPGLAATGPDSKSKVSHPADMTLNDVTCVMTVTPAAIEQWESAPWG